MSRIRTEKISSIEAADIVLRRRKIKTDLVEWAKYVQPSDQQPAAPHLYLLDHLSGVEARKSDRLMISMPPAHAKSTYSCVIFVTWFLARNPGAKIICATNSDKLALDFSKSIRALIEAHSAVLGYSLAKGSEAVNSWATTNGCKYTVLGVGSSSQGLRADLLIIDDVFGSREDAESKKVRNTVFRWYQSDMQSRLTATGRVVMVGTRWHEDDLMGRLVDAQTDNWEIINLPAVCESPEDPLGREIGEALWPEVFSNTVLDRIKRNNNPLDWSSMYMGRPAPAEGSLFKIENLTCLDTIPVDAAQIVRAWDLAATRQTGSKNPDWTVGLKLARYPDGRLVILDVVRLRGDPHEVEAAIVATASQDGSGVRISIPQDPGAAGKALSQYLTSKLIGYRVDTSQESGDKTTRAYAIASQIAVGNVSYLRATWNHALLSELASFPAGHHDDQVDALSRAASMLIQIHKPLRSLSMSFGVR